MICQAIRLLFILTILLTAAVAPAAEHSGSMTSKAASILSLADRQDADLSEAFRGSSAAALRGDMSPEAYMVAIEATESGPDLEDVFSAIRAESMLEDGTGFSKTGAFGTVSGRINLARRLAGQAWGWQSAGHQDLAKSAWRASIMIATLDELEVGASTLDEIVSLKAFGAAPFTNEQRAAISELAKARIEQANKSVVPYLDLSRSVCDWLNGENASESVVQNFEKYASLHPNLSNANQVLRVGRMLLAEAIARKDQEAEREIRRALDEWALKIADAQLSTAVAGAMLEPGARPNVRLFTPIERP